MALDGVMISSLVYELQSTLTGGRIDKISMPERDELLLHIAGNSKTFRLLISANASLPLMYLTDENKPSPTQAPTFCMLLRRHISSGRIQRIYQEGLERVITIEISHLDDLDRPCLKKLIIELMGKYSNIIFTDDQDRIIDSIKRIPPSISSLREVLPGRYYYLPDELKKDDPLTTAFSLNTVEGTVIKSIYSTYAGISPLLAAEMCTRAGIDGDKSTSQLTDAETESLSKSFEGMINDIKNHVYSPVLIKRGDVPYDFSPFKMLQFSEPEFTQHSYASPSVLLEDFYQDKESYSRMRQKTADLRKITTNCLERAVKKLDLQNKQLKDCANKDKYKVYGDLINTYGYELSGGEDSLTCKNYYDEDREIRIPLDPHKTASANAKKYYDKYAKCSRTEKALSQEITKTSADIAQLESILMSLNLSADESDLNEIRKELIDSDYLKGSNNKNNNQGNARNKGKQPPKSVPMHFVSSDGYDIYVGKNNIQNEELSFKLSSPDDWWFHAKGVPGSHVIVKTEKDKEIPDSVFIEAGSLAAYYSKASDQDKVEVDYTRCKNLKKAPGAAPGFVIYHTNYSMVVSPSDRPCKAAKP